VAYYITKILITTVLVVLISEVSKRSSLLGAILASIPLVSVLAMLWLYIDTKNIEKISALSSNIFWLVLPSLVLFIALPLLLKQGFSFYLSMGISVALTIVAYALMLIILDYFGIKL
jgi:hypothetical protein